MLHSEGGEWPTYELLKGRLGRALSNVVYWEVSLLTTRGMEPDDL